MSKELDVKSLDVSKDVLGYNGLEDNKVYRAVISREVLVKKQSVNTLNQRYLEVVNSEWGDYFTLDADDFIDMGGDDNLFKVVFKDNVSKEELVKIEADA